MVLAAAGAVLWGCGPAPPGRPAPPDAEASISGDRGGAADDGPSFDRPAFAESPGAVPASVGSPSFSDVHAEAGFDFVYENGANGRKLMVESTGGGVGWLDYDADGRPDLYCVQGGNPTRVESESGPPDRLFRNLGGGKFADVGESPGTSDVGYGQGVAIGDFDVDGFDDVYVTNVGGNVLFRNQGDGTFEDSTSEAGVRDGRWSTSAAWADLDTDGDLDLYVCNYVDYDPRQPLICLDGEEPAVCDPTALNGAPDECYFNLGDGRFSPEAAVRGLEPNDGSSKSLGVAVCDFDGDGLSDVFVANDTTANYCFINRGTGRFQESAVSLGCAMNALGLFQASMGVGVGDYDRDGHPDLYLTHFTDDSNTLYRNLGTTGFEDVTRRVGLHQPTLPYLGFGTVMADLNRDGREDIFVANGHIQDLRRKGGRFAMRPQLFSFAGPRWVEKTDDGGEYFRGEYVGRAVASCDFDDDGDLDLAVINQNAPAALLRNETVAGHWLKVRLRGTADNRRGVGAIVRVRSGRDELVQQLYGGTSYCASHEPVVLFGLRDDAACRVEVRWPNGTIQEDESVPVDRTLILRQPEPGSSRGRRLATAGRQGR